MRNELPQQVHRHEPFGKISPRRIVTIAVEQIHPVVRIAHQQWHPIDIRERILFDHEFVLIRKGTGTLVLGDEQCAYKPNDLLFIPPFLPHHFQSLAKGEGEHIAVHFDFAPQMVSTTSDLGQRLPYEVRIANALPIPHSQSLAAGHPLEQTFLDLVQARQSRDPLSELQVSRAMFTVLALTLSAEPEGMVPSSPSAVQARNSARIDRVIAFIHANLQKTLDAETLAQEGDISVSRMNTLFREATGYSPLEYVRRARVAEARQLLADLELSVKEIAARTGFEDSFHFSKVFRKIDGLSPTHYRDALVASRRS